MSAADIFTYLYFEEMNIDPKDPKKADRDRFVLSKGHTAPGQSWASTLITWKLNASNFLSIGYGEHTSSILPSI